MMWKQKLQDLAIGLSGFTPRGGGMRPYMKEGEKNQRE